MPVIAFIGTPGSNPGSSNAVDVSASSPLPVTGSGGGGEVSVNINQVDGVPLATSPAGTLPVYVSSSTPLSAVVNLTNTDGTAPTLKALNNGSQVLSAEFDNTAATYSFANFQLRARGASAFPSGSLVDCWVIPAIDGTNYEDASASVTPARSPDFTFYLRAVSTQQILTPGGPPVGLFPVPPCKFKVLVRNTTITSGVAFTNTDNENYLSVGMS